MLTESNVSSFVHKARSFTRSHPIQVKGVVQSGLNPVKHEGDTIHKEEFEVGV